MNYKVTRNDQQTGKWFNTALEAWQYIDKQLAIETTMGFPRHNNYKAYYNLSGTQVDRAGEPI